MPLPKPVTKPASLLLFALFLILPILGFVLGVYFQQKYSIEITNPFCKNWSVECDPRYTDPNGGCVPRKVCADEKNTTKPTKDLQKACEEKGGNWLDTHKECESADSSKGLDQQACTTLGGTFNECDSACRHQGKDVVCVAVCVKTCTF